MDTIETALRTLLLKRTDSTEDEINALAEPLNRRCLHCLDAEHLEALASEFRQNCIEAGHNDVAEMLDGNS